MKTFLKVTLTLAALTGVAVLVLAVGKQPEPFASGTESASRLQLGPLPVALGQPGLIPAKSPTGCI
jgi:hypothetical protein